MGAATKLKAGDKVRITLENGWQTLAVVVRVFKNGRIGARKPDGKYHVYGFMPGDKIESSEPPKTKG